MQREVGPVVAPQLPGISLSVMLLTGDQGPEPQSFAACTLSDASPVQVSVKSMVQVVPLGVKTPDSGGVSSQV